MTLAHVLRAGLAPPATEQTPHHDMGSLRVAGKIFLTWPAEGSRVHLFVPVERAEALAAANPGEAELLYWGAKVCGLRVPLPAAEGLPLAAWIEEAWAAKAPARLRRVRGGAG
jgi:hypothetical protein